MKKILIIGIVGLLFMSGTFFLFQNLNKQNTLLNKTTNDIDMTIDTDDGDEDINWNSYVEQDITSEKDLVITEAGIYNLSGSMASVKVNTTGDVKLVLDNVTIQSQNGPGIYVEQAENVVISLKDGTKNVIEDSSSYNLDDTDISGAIFSKSDLIFEGSGSLSINANYLDGIVSKDDLKIINGIYNITSVDDGIRGKDSVYILDGNFTINSGGDGIKATNDTDTTKGFIQIENGIFKITSELDGIQAQTKLLILNGDFTINTGGGSINSSTSNDSWGNWGRNPMGMGNSNSSFDTESAKGLKSQDNLVIENGQFNFDTSDDAIHSNNYVGIKDGEFTISSGDDGMHADSEMIIDGGTIEIKKSYEGIEASAITINNGNISLCSSDDGINVAGGNDLSGMNRPGASNFKDSKNILIINNGNILVNATGDGIDINGNGYMYNGTVYVEGPTNDGNGSLDYDGEFVVDGGTLIASGSNGMLQTISSEKQYNVTITFNMSNSANTEVKIVDENNNEIVHYSPTKTFSSFIVSSSLFEQNKTYSILLDNDEYETFTIEKMSTTIGNNRNNQPTMGGQRR